MNGRSSALWARLPWKGALALLAACLWASVLFAAGCARQIGDSCSTNVDCSPLGNRYCDLSSPDGYCTIEGCDSASCPDSAVCIRFFSPKITQGPSCLPMQTPMSPMDCPSPTSSCCPAGKKLNMSGSQQCCQIGEQCLCSDTTLDGCDPAKGSTNFFCASESTEHRWCMHPCSSDSDCRNGYRCLTSGTNGTQAVTQSDGGVRIPVLQFCAPPL
jgi:hypothetical protein